MPLDFAISKTPAPATLHIIKEILIRVDLFSKYSMIFFALDPAPEAKIATCIGLAGSADPMFELGPPLNLPQILPK